jgi:hypothetical protein
MARVAKRGLTVADFKRIALSFEGAVEGAHMGAVDFRIGGRIFATLAHGDKGYGNLMFTPKEQAAFIEEWPAVFLPVHGGWGRGGATHVRLGMVTEEVLTGALGVAWKLRKDKNAGVTRKRGR